VQTYGKFSPTRCYHAAVRTPVVLSFSGGKDSTLALDRLIADPRYEVVALLTTVNARYQRASLQGIRRELLEAQADALGFPLRVVELPDPCPNEAYEAAMMAALEAFAREGVRTFAFGDIFLADVRRYREERLLRADWEAVFPLWGESSTVLAREVIERGFRAVVTCVDTHQLAPEFAGRTYDAAFLADLPPGVDPCGERGEFHTCVIGGPIFPRPLDVLLGEHVLREERFLFCDLLLAGPVERRAFGTSAA
jgi:uncharacterized protein (TIGR00290 family)